ncbi:MAG TPA: tetratricopeptide repeat protein, partial [Blastocatellia bacterium]|nr:tetratricopeptide repeat protein [Blastocatellia bacterium]
MCRFTFLLLLCVLSVVVAKGQVTPLAITNPIEREIKGGESHLYQLTLAAGECVVLGLDANKAHVICEAWVEKDKILAGGELEKATKKFWLVAEHATTYFLRITQDTQTYPQPYRLCIAEQRPATEADRNIVQAQSDQLQAIIFYGLANEDSHRQAASYSRKAAERWEAAGSTIDAAVNYNLLGLSLQRLDEISTATQAYEQALQRFKALGNRELEANTINNLAGLLLRAGEPQQALNYLSSIQVTEDQRIPVLQVGRAFVFSGIAYRLLGDLTQARSFLELGLQFIRTPEKNVYTLNAEARALLELGQICLSLGDHSQAQAHLRQSLVVLKENDSLFRMLSGHVRRVIGDVHFSRGEYQQAQEVYRETLTNFQQVGSPFHRASIRNDLGATALVFGRDKEAQEWYAEALALGETIHNVPVESIARVGLARVEQLRGDFAAALTQVEQALQLVESQRAQIVSPD